MRLGNGEQNVGCVLLFDRCATRKADLDLSESAADLPGHIIWRDLAIALSSDSDKACHAKRLPAKSVRNVAIAAVNPVAGPPIYRISKDGSLRLAAPYPASYPEQAEAAATSKDHPTNYGLAPVVN